MASFCVKDVRIGEGRPKTIVSLMEATEQETVQTAAHVAAAGADCLEWRADFASNVHDPTAMARTARHLMVTLPNTPLVFTFRSASQGGKLAMETSEYVELNEAIIDARGADFVDVEMGIGDDAARQLASKAHEHGLRAIVSHHDFESTPSVAHMMNLFARMTDLGADLPKLAVMAHCASDCMRLMDAAAQAHDELKTPLVAMAMGEHGKLSRLAGEAYGSALTFCAVGQSSAPGQVELVEATDVLDRLHKVLRP